MYYSTPENSEGETDSSHQIYNRLTYDTHNTGGQLQAIEMDSTLEGNYEMLETVSNHRLSYDGMGEEVCTADQPLPHSKVEMNPIKNDEDKDIANPQEEWSPSAIYAHVNKKKSKKKEVSEDPPCESGDVHSVVSIPSAPEIPQKSQLLLEELN